MAVLLLGFALVLVLPLWALIDLVRHTQADFERAGQSQLVWALIIIFVAIIGPALYLTIGRQRLATATRATS